MFNKGLPRSCTPTKSLAAHNPIKKKWATAYAKQETVDRTGTVGFTRALSARPDLIPKDAVAHCLADTAAKVSIDD